MVVFRRDILDLQNGSILIGLSKDINGARVAGCLQKGIPEFQKANLLYGPFHRFELFPRLELNVLESWF